MGLIFSILCSFTFCIERVLTWTCCAVLLMFVMLMLLVLMLYGISVGYHYAQKELAAFAENSVSTTTPQSLRRAADVADPQSVVRLVAVNRTRPGHALQLEQPTKPPEQIFMDSTVTSLVLLETDRYPKDKFQIRIMGVIQSVFCSIIFCIERVLTWTCCAFMLMLLMAILILLMVYGISVGYHYAQKELSSFAMSSRVTTPEPKSADGRRSNTGPDLRPVVHMVAVNRSEAEQALPPLLEVYRTNKPREDVYLEAKETPIVLLETERPPQEPELSPNERELAKKLIGRFRRSKNITEPPFLRPLNQRKVSDVLRLST